MIFLQFFGLLTSATSLLLENYQEKSVLNPTGNNLVTFSVTVSPSPYEKIPLNSTIVLDSIPKGILKGTLIKHYNNSPLFFDNISTAYNQPFSILASSENYLDAYYSPQRSLRENFYIEMDFCYNQTVSFPFTVFIYLKVSGGDIWTETETISLISDSKLLKKKEINGFGEIEITFEKQEEFSLTASAGDFISVTKKIMIYPIKLLFIDFPYTNDIFNTSYTFEVTIAVGDYLGQIPDKQHHEYTIELSLSCYTSYCSGTKLSETTLSKESTNSMVTFSNFQVLSSGYFILNATCKMYDAFDDSERFYVYNSLKKINAKLTPGTASQGSLQTLTIRLIAEDDDLYFNCCDLDISSSKKIILESGYCSYGSIDYLNGIITSNITFLEHGTNSLYIKCGNFTKVIEDIKIKKLALKAVNYGKTNIFEKEYLSLQVQVFDYYDDMMHDYNGYPVWVTIDGDAKADPGVGEFEYSSLQKIKYQAKNGFLDLNLAFNSGGKVYINFVIGNTESNKLGPFNIGFPKCGMHSGPISSYSVLIVLYITLSGIFYYFDKNVRTYKPVQHLFFFIYPLTGFCYKQPGYRRLLLCAQAFVSELLIITIIGAMYFIHDSTKASLYSDFEHFDKHQLEIGAQGYALAQAPIITFFILNFYFVNNRKAIVLSIGLSVVFIFLCFGGVIYMSKSSCIGYSTYWTANFMIFWMFDLITFQVFYSFIFMWLLPKNYKILLKGTQTDDLKQNQGVVVVRFNDDFTENAEGNPAVNQSKLNSSFPKFENNDNIEEAKAESEPFYAVDINAIDVNVAE